MSNRFCLALIALLFNFLSAAGAWAVGPWHAAGPNTTGWQFMTPDERIEHQRRMRSFGSYEECSAYQAEHHALMAERALREGVELKRKTESGCEQLRQRGNLK